ncbi:MAG: flavin reductase domain protein FMN-binding protein [Caulobacter sp.]|nr:flavin reductase domain protein FMN-binding protein [Caulobacter sp.]
MADGSDFAAAIVARALEAEVDDATFRQAMSRLAGGVAVVACQTSEGPRGLLVSSLITLSVAPARVLFCVRKEAAAHNHLTRANRVSISVLSDAHGAEAERFSGPHLAQERFTASHWRIDANAPPALTGALISLTGHREQLIDAGSHSMFIVRIADAASADLRPLIYFGRDFHGLENSKP